MRHNTPHRNWTLPSPWDHRLIAKPRKMKMRFGPSGLHLFDRNTGLNLLLDEVRTSPDKWCQAPRHVSVALTNACDLRCNHCYAPKHKSVSDVSSLMRWMLELDRHGCLGVGFGGGEPTLHPHFVEICNRVVAESDLAVSLTTHGLHLDKKLLQAMRGCVHFVRVSMDGIGTTYENLRGKPFTELLARLELLSEAIPFGINYVVNAATLPELDGAVKLADKLGARQFLLLPQRTTARVGNLDEDTRIAMTDWVRSYHCTLPLAISQGDTEGIPICDPFAEEDDGLRSYLHIDSDGMLKKTSYDTAGVFIDERGVMAALDLLKKPH